MKNSIKSWFLRRVVEDSGRCEITTGMVDEAERMLRRYYEAERKLKRSYAATLEDSCSGMFKLDFVSPGHHQPQNLFTYATDSFFLTNSMTIRNNKPFTITKQQFEEYTDEAFRFHLMSAYSTGECCDPNSYEPGPIHVCCLCGEIIRPWKDAYAVDEHGRWHCGACGNAHGDV